MKIKIASVDEQPSEGRKDDTAALLAERGKTHGDFYELSVVAQALKDVMRCAPNWEKLPELVREALDMEASKNARILCGDYSFLDHWDDKIGYCRLVADRLREERLSAS